METEVKLIVENTLTAEPAAEVELETADAAMADSADIEPGGSEETEWEFDAPLLPEAFAVAEALDETAALSERDGVAVFEDGLAGELAKLRLAIAALDRAFARPEPLGDELPPAEPSFADLVSDTAMRAAG